MTCSMMSLLWLMLVGETGFEPARLSHRVPNAARYQVTVYTPRVDD